jgi:hypothetical protein
MSLKLCDFFGFSLKEEPSLYSKESRELLALEGDAILNLCIIRALLKTSHPSGWITVTKKKFVSRYAQAYFIHHSDFRELFPDTTIQTLNDHSLSTWFESFIALCPKSNLAQVIKDYMMWIERSGFEMPQSVDAEICLDSGGKVFSLNFEDETFQIAQENIQLRIALSKSIIQPIKVEKSKSLQVAQENSSWASIIKENEMSSDRSHLASEIVGVTWQSLANNTYKDYYYPCCGTFLKTDPIRSSNMKSYPHSEDNICKVYSLPPAIRYSVHPGKLRNIPSSRKKGGGLGIGSLTKGRYPLWSCCNRVCEPGVPGCELSIGSEKVNVWSILVQIPINNENSRKFELKVAGEIQPFKITTLKEQKNWLQIWEPLTKEFLTSKWKLIITKEDGENVVVVLTKLQLDNFELKLFSDVGMIERPRYYYP